MQTIHRKNDVQSAFLADDTQGTFLLGDVFEDCNERACRLWGCSRETVIGSTLLDLSPDMQPDGVVSHQRLEQRLQAARAGLPQSFEWRFRHKDGDLIDTLLSLEAIETGSRARIVGRMCNVTSLKRAENTLHESENRLEQVLNNATARKRTEEALRNAALGVSSSKGEEVFAQIVRYLATTVGVDFAFVGLLLNSPRDRINALAVYDRGTIARNIEYDLDEAPCQTVVGQQFRFIPDHVQELYPGDTVLGELGIKGYAGYPLFSSTGCPLGLIAVMDRKPLVDRDVTESMLKIFSVRAAAELERMYSDEARRISEASYRAIFEAAEDAIFIHDIETGAIVDVNPKACLAYGYTYDELKQLDVGKLSSGEHPYTLAEAGKLMEKAKAGKPLRFEWQRRNKDGSLHWDEVWLKRAVIAGVDRIVAFTREITERKQAEQGLRASEEQYRSIFNASADGLALWNAEGRIVDANPAFWSMHGYTREELLSIDPRRFIHPDSHPLFEQFLKSANNVRIPFHAEARGVRKDGTVFDVEVHGVRMFYQGRLHLLSIVRDITERKQAEQERIRLEGQLRQAQKMEAIGHLTGGIAHDFNNILTGVMGYVVLALERQERHNDAKLAQYLENAYRSGQRARDLIQQMLTFSRGQRGEPKPLSLPPIVKESIKLLSSTVPSTVEFQTDLDGNVPLILLDPVQIEQVLMNLCINARDAMAGSGTIKVALRTVTHGDAVCASCRQPVSGSLVELMLADTGPGIAPEIVERIFEPFFTTKELGKGSGMGLATVHGIVHEHGGHILVDTVPGAGTTFRILFKPLEPTCSDVKQAMPEDSVPAEPDRSLSGHVLVVDDDDMVAEFIGELLENAGLEVSIHHESLEACNVFNADPQQFDLALLDQTMPKMTGLELARHFLASRPDLPIILYTGYSEGLSEQELRDCGIRALLRKPVDVAALYALVSGLLPQEHDIKA